MTIDGLPEAYCDVAYADNINASSAWVAASTTEKEDSLQWARVYFDDKYTCNYWDTAPTNVLTANAMLGEEYLLDSSLFFDGETTVPKVKSKFVKAGDVEARDVFYDDHVVSETDNFPRITALVGNVCYIASGSFGSSTALRR